MKGFRYLHHATTVELAAAACIGCGRCAEVCPHQVFRITGKKAAFADREACMECGACMRNCPVAAITVDAGVGCATGLINEWLQERNIRWGSGGCCS